MPEKLTEKRIRSLRTTQAQVEILHCLTPSAGIRVTKDGRKTFFMIYRSPETGQRNATKTSAAAASPTKA